MEKFPGYLVAIEGMAYSGKTTQADNLNKLFRDNNIDSRVLKELSDTEFGRRIKNLLIDHSGKLHLDSITKILLFESAKREIVTSINPEIHEGKSIILPSYLMATKAYQGFGDREGDSSVLATIVQQEKLIVENRIPDLTFILDAPAEKSFEETKNGQAYFFNRKRDLAYHKRVSEGFKAMAYRERKKGAIFIGIMPQESVKDYVREIIEKTILLEHKSESLELLKKNTHKHIEDYVSERRESIWEKAYKHTKDKTESLY